MSFWDELAETAEGLVTDPVGTVSDRVSDAADAAEWAVDEFQEEYLEPETGTITPAPPQPDGPYDPTGVPTKPEILAFVEGFEPPVRDAMIREVAKELYPGWESYIDMSKEQWEDHKAGVGDNVTIGGDGWGAETITTFKWYDGPEIVLPTVDGMNYYQGYAPMGPDPDAVIGDIEAAGEERAKILVGDLRTACDTALQFDDLDGMFHTAQAHSDLYAAFDATQSDLSTTLAHIEALGQNWEGKDAETFREQYSEAVREALQRHIAIALNLTRGADSDLAMQIGLHFAVAGALRNGQARIDELSVRRLFGDQAISVLTTTGLVTGTVGLAPVLGPVAASTIGITGLLSTIGGLAGVDATLNPKTELIPSAEKVREVMTTMVEGVGQAAQEASDLRAECAAQLRNLSQADFDLIGTTYLVAGSGY
ncbi:hypothetical protein [Glycomyces rhizosphaerae]|uniref:Uncharacterized protein n=1 Tax=Glycomyces rhizosphaerae TaxID=2054422 RepID=A0ABV7Q4E6_9ACTN